MDRVELPNGGWADIRTENEIKVRQRKLIRSAAMAAISAVGHLPDSLPTDAVEASKVDMSTLDLSMEEADSLQAMQEATVVAFLAAWSLPEELPTMATVGDMDVVVFDALAEATAERGAKMMLADSAHAPTPKDVPGNPTGSSDASAGLSKATATAQLTPV